LTVQEMVREFHDTFNLPASDKPVPGPLLGDRVRRMRLIDEECEETLDELDRRAGAFDLAALAKELADLVYVVYGTAVEFGIPLDAVIVKVHESNMAKVGPDGVVTYRADGKVSKPDGWRPPDIGAVLG
jgi:predicted HAD superfamily Cof-like phosphohydrolase